jgi:hypothetical protein
MNGISRLATRRYRFFRLILSSAQTSSGVSNGDGHSASTSIGGLSARVGPRAGFRRSGSLGLRTNAARSPVRSSASIAAVDQGCGSMIADNEVSDDNTCATNDAAAAAARGWCALVLVPSAQSHTALTTIHSWRSRRVAPA